MKYIPSVLALVLPILFLVPAASAFAATNTPTDYDIFQACLGKSATFSNICAKADFNKDGTINNADLALFKYASGYDVNGDGVLELTSTSAGSDIAILKSCFDSQSTYMSYACSNADLNGDSTVNNADLTLFKSASEFDLNGDGKVDFSSTNAPVVTRVSPASAGNGTTITIYGTGLSGATFINFYNLSNSLGAREIPSTVSPTQITLVINQVLAGDGPVGAGLIRVVTPNGTSNTLNFTLNAFKPLPVITSTSAPGNGAFEMYAGSWVNISGRNFSSNNVTGVPSVFIGGIQATVLRVTDSQLHVMVPRALAPAPGRTYKLYVKNGNGTSNTVQIKILGTVGKIIPSTTFVNFSAKLGDGKLQTYSMNLTNASSVPVNIRLSIPNQPKWWNASYNKNTITIVAGGVLEIGMAADTTKVTKPGTYTSNLIINGNFTGSPITILVTFTVAQTSQSPVIISVRDPRIRESGMTPGDAVLISGRNFFSNNVAGVPSVFIGGIKATVNQDTDILLNVTVPGTLTPGNTYGIYVKNYKGFSSNIVQMKVLPRRTKILSPNGGEVWQVGKTYQIKWSASSYPTSAKISLGLRDSRYSLNLPSGEGVIVDTTKNTGSYSFTVPSSLGSLSGGTLGGNNVYRVVLYVGRGSATDTSKFGMSDAPFSITKVNKPSITVTYPNGGEQFRVGKNVDFRTTWSSKNLTGNVQVYMSFHDGGLCFLGTVPVSQGTFPVVLTNPNGSGYKCSDISKTITSGQYKIFLDANINASNEEIDTSDNYFTVTFPTVAKARPTINSISPTHGLRDTSIVIQGTNLKSGGEPKIELRTTSGVLKGTAYFVNTDYLSSQRISFKVNEVSSPVGPLAPGTYKVTVVAPNGTSNAANFTLNFPSNALSPTITSIQSEGTTGTITAGGKATIYGSGLSGPLTIKIGIVNPKIIKTTGISDSLAVFTVPEYQQPLTASITVTNSSGKTSYYYSVHIFVPRSQQTPFKILSFYPTSGRVGSTVTIHGTGFTTGNAKMKPVPYLEFDFGNEKELYDIVASTKSSTSATIKLPTYMSAGIYKVKGNRSGIFTPEASNTFKVVARSGSQQTPFKILSFYPTSGKAGSTVTIHGTGFNVGEIGFDFTKASSVYDAMVSAINSTSATIKLPSKIPAGAYTIRGNYRGILVTSSSNTFKVISASQSASNNVPTNNVQPTQSNTTNNTTTTQTFSSASQGPFSQNLWRGQNSHEVVWLQRLLNKNSQTRIAVSGPGSQGKETGYYGYLTQAAVQNFQCKNHIVCSGSPDSTGYGVVGPKTREKLNELYGQGGGSTSAITGGINTTNISTSKAKKIAALEAQIQQILQVVLQLQQQLAKQAASQ